MQTLIPHAATGLSPCRGFLYGRVTGQNALIACNDCAVVIRIVPAADLQRVLDDMKLQLDLVRAAARSSTGGIEVSGVRRENACDTSRSTGLSAVDISTLPRSQARSSATRPVPPAAPMLSN